MSVPLSKCFMINIIAYAVIIRWITNPGIIQVEEFIMKLSAFFELASFGMKTVLFKKKDAILGTIILTDKCNLKCKHCWGIMRKEAFPKQIKF